MNIWLLAVSSVASLSLVALAIPLIRRRVPPNRLYGLRVPATFADEWVWYEANACSGRDLLYLGIALTVMTIGIAVLGLGTTAYLVWAIALFMGAIGGGITGWLRANRLLKERRRAS